MKVNYGWVVVAVGALLTCVAMGTEFSLAVYLPPMSAETGWSRAGISSAMTLDFLAMGLGGFVWGAVSDRFGPRPVVLSGAILLGAGELLASRTDSLLVFQLTYGLLVGTATGAVYIPLMAAVTNWFDRQRGLAVSLVSVGFGVAPMTISPLARYFVTEHGWRWSMSTIALIAWALMIPAALLLRRADAAAMAGAEGVEEKGVETSLSQALRSRAFFFLAATFFFCCTAHAGPIFHTMSYAISCGIAPMAATTVYSVEGLAGLGGRLLFGMAADRYGARPVLAVGLLIQALGIAAYSMVSELNQFYAMAVVLGAAYGGLMPLYAVLA
ncbi:MAG TPA: MFS transporter, partial [Magnetospirillaceae bacterium]|nr:MFS transporter [Magnetospirillaceae bacterium]